MQTTLNLLTRDGAVYMAFSPHLTPVQYTELVRVSEMAENATELRQLVSVWAAEEGIAHSFDPAKEPA
jgi:hypothetical protein